MEVLIVSGIWPPAVGGPASHGPEFGRFLVERGHGVRAMTAAGAQGPAESGFPVTAARNDRARLLRQPAAAAALMRAAAGVDVIYATGLYGRSSMTSRLRRTPLVMKLVSDPAFERARRLGLFSGTLEEFQTTERPIAIRALKRARDLALSRPSRIVIPSRYLAEIANTWGNLGPRIRVVPNPAPRIQRDEPRSSLRERLGITGPTFVFAGRVTAQKNLPLAITALGGVDGASLVIVGDGPATPEVEAAIATAGVGDRVRMLGALPRDRAIEWMRAADACVLPSDWENFPHAAVEALAAGTPVVATAVGGVPEIIDNGVNGVLIDRGDESALTNAMNSLLSDSDLIERLRTGAEASAGAFDVETVYGTIAAELEAVAGAGSRR